MTCHVDDDWRMFRMKVSLPDQMREFVEGQVAVGEFASTSEYFCALIRRNQKRQQLRDVLLAGLESGEGCVADSAFFAEVRASAGLGT